VTERIYETSTGSLPAEGWKRKGGEDKNRQEKILWGPHSFRMRRKGGEDIRQGYSLGGQEGGMKGGRSLGYFTQEL